jgi:16S rRNA (cytidine1402-2'-O)-methyltransferase
VKLTIVPTPIGNLEDITLRAVRILKEANHVLAEDTRVASKLLSHLGISTPLTSYHAANEHRQLNRCLEIIRANANVALISDAGTPGISDPGFLLVRACISENIEVECLPGATAMIPALINSGFSSHHFTFLGFLPHKKGRETMAREIAHRKETCILYESPHRLMKTLDLLRKHCGDSRRVSISRELTKHFEETRRGKLSELIDYFSQNAVRGEFVIVIDSLAE